MKIEFHRYTLPIRKGDRLNARSTRGEFSGALIRVEETGVGCIHPWTELGDLSLDDELLALKAGTPQTLGAVALECANSDGRARKKGESLFQGLSHTQLPASHWSVGPDDDPDALAADGFDIAKLKLSTDIEAAVGLVERWAASTGMGQLRLDFNTSLTGGQFVEFWNSLSEPAQRRIQFIEDPTPFDLDQWRDLQAVTGAEFAIDLRPGQVTGDWDSWLILKPAVLTQERQRYWIEKHGPAKIVFTSYMDHAIGQAWAMYCASRFPEIQNAGGLLSHERFSPEDEFFKLLERRGPRLQPPDGTGLGFDNLLEGLPWKLLN